MAKTLPARVWTLPVIGGQLRSATQTSTPSQVTGLTETDVTTTSISLTWNLEQQAASYNVYLNGVLNQSVQQPCNTQATISGLTQGTLYSITVEAVNINGSAGPISAALNVSTDSDAVVSPWPTQAADGRIHAIPGLNVFGSDSYGGGGRHPGSTGVDIILVNTRSSANTAPTAVSGLGSNVYEGTLEGALRMNSGTRGKLIIPTVSGWIDARKAINIGASSDNVSLYGQFAPGPGLFTRGLVINFGGKSHVQFWHMGFYIGDDAAGAAIDNRDGLKVAAGGSHKIIINCEFAWTMDESVDGYTEFDEVGFVYCAFIDPLHETAHPDIPGDGPEHGFGPLLGAGGGFSDRISFERNLFAHITSRSPWVGARRGTLGNNIMYNNARCCGTDRTGDAGQFSNQWGHTSSILYNYGHSLWVRGPDNSSHRLEVNANSASFPSGSGVYIVGVVINGWTPAAGNDMSDYLTAPASFAARGTVASTALPSGRETDLSDMVEISADPENATLAEKLDFVSLMEDSVGMNPAFRQTGVGRVETVFQQIRNRLNGVSDSSQYVDTVAEAGGWFSAPQMQVTSPTDPGSHWHAPMPTDAGRHTPYVSGTFSNGVSRVGYTPMEVWAIEQHWYKGGK